MPSLITGRVVCTTMPESVPTCSLGWQEGGLLVWVGGCRVPHISGSAVQLARKTTAQFLTECGGMLRRAGTRDGDQQGRRLLGPGLVAPREAGHACARCGVTLSLSS